MRQPSHMRTSHARPAQRRRRRGGPDPRAQDVYAGRKDVHVEPVVGPRGPGVVDVDGGDGEDAELVGALDGGLEGRGVAAAQGHGDDGFGGAAGCVGDVGHGPLVSVEDKVRRCLLLIFISHLRDQQRPRPDSLGRRYGKFCKTHRPVAKHFDRHDIRLLRHPVRLTRYDARAMRPVALRVHKVRVRIRIVPEEAAALKLGVLLVEARVDDVGPRPLAGRVVVDVRVLVRRAVGDGAEAPGGRALRHEVG
jgi:hypothetical protein